MNRLAMYQTEEITKSEVKECKVNVAQQLANALTGDMVRVLKEAKMIPSGADGLKISVSFSEEPDYFRLKLIIQK